MEYNYAYQYAVQKSSEEFGSDVIKKINNKPISNAKGRLSYIINMIQSLSNFFETQNLAAVKSHMKYLKEFNDYVKSSLDGDGQDMKGILKNINQYFSIEEFKRDPEKQKAISLFLKHYVTFIKDNVKTITVDEFLEITEFTPLEGRYFDKEKVFGDIIRLVEEYN